MFRMSQKLLKAFFILFFSYSYCWAGNWELVKSIEVGPDNEHLKSPMGIYLYPKNNRLYIMDSGNSRLISYTFEGKPLKEFDAGGQLKFPTDMIKDSNGNLVVVERATNSLVFINLREKKVVKKKVKNENSDIFLGKIDTWKDKILILDKYSGKIFILNSKFDVETELRPSDKDFTGFYDMKVKGDYLWAMESLTGRIFKFSFINKSFQLIDPKKKFVEPVSFDVDQNGNIYILERYYNKVFIFDNKGNPLNTQLKSGSRPGELYYPWYIRIFKNKIFILDEGNGRVDIFKY